MEDICPKTQQIDSILCEVDADINWLEMVSPTDNHERWVTFKNSNYSKVLPLSYREVNTDLDKLTQQLNRLDFSKVKNPILSALMHEKKEELDLFIDLIKYRDTDGFLATSIYLFGGTEPALLNLSKEILSKVPEEVPGFTEMAPVSEFVQYAEDTRHKYNQHDNTFHFNINLEEDLNSSLMVNFGDLYISDAMHVPRNRIKALIAHEVEVHILTSFNGSKQPLKLMKTGLANYDTLQEGLATFSEYLSGNLSAKRLRVLAARVVASDLAIKGEPLINIFQNLFETYGIDDWQAFDIAVRAKRGGGLTKDSVYLQGLKQVHSYVKSDGCLDKLFIGKFSLNQRQMLEKLVADKVLLPPAITPKFLQEANCQKALEEAKKKDLIQLFN